LINDLFAMLADIYFGLNVCDLAIFVDKNRRPLRAFAKAENSIGRRDLAIGIA
jgi:hypothetical protein